MNTRNSFVFLITISYIINQGVASAVGNTLATQNSDDQILNLQAETGHLCSYLEGTSFVTTKKFIRIMQDAHVYCPDMEGMEVTLTNIAIQADIYHSYVTQQTRACEELLYMLTKSLDNGDSVNYYLKEGNYSNVTTIINKWHQKFLELKSTFYLTNTPLDIMINNKKIFYYDNWIGRVIDFASSLTAMLITSVILAKVLGFMGLIFPIIGMFFSFLRIRFVNLPKFVTIIVCLPILYGLLVIGGQWFPAKISLSGSPRYNWYPDATAALEKMRDHNDKVQWDVSRQIRLIEDLQYSMNMYYDETILANIDDLVRNVRKGIEAPSKELLQVFEVSSKLSSAFREVYKSIEAKAKKAGRLDEAKNLLILLTNTSQAHENYHHSVERLIIQQRKRLPELKEQAETMQTLVRVGHVMEIGRAINYQINIVKEIDGCILNVSIAVKQTINILGNDRTTGMKQTIEELKDEIVNDQFWEKAFGTVGVLGGTVSALIAFKSGYAAVTIGATVVAGPAGLAVGAVGLASVAAYSVVTNFKNYNHGSHYIKELDSLNALRENLLAKMKNLEKAIIDQQDASNKVQISLNNIATRAASFSNSTSFKLPVDKRLPLSNELQHIVFGYNLMLSLFNSFETHTTGNDDELLLE